MKIKKILIEDETGRVRPITTLMPEEYEQFLKETHQLRLAYIALTRDRQENQ